MRAWVNLGHDVKTDGPIILNDDDFRKITDINICRFRGIVYTKPDNQSTIDGVSYENGDMVLYHYIKDDENKTECDELYVYIAGSNTWWFIEPSDAIRSIYEKSKSNIL